MTRACLFCGVSGCRALSDEHVIPQWLLRHLDLPDDDLLFQGVAESKTGQLSMAPRVHSTFRFVEGRVCQTCNSGWMSRLESAAQPVLIELMDSARQLRTLSESESAVIAKWAAKTAYLHTYAGPMKKPVRGEHLKQLTGDSGVPVSGVGVFANQMEHVKPSGYVQTGTWPQLLRAEVAVDGQTPVDAYKIGLQFRRLYLLVAFWPNPTSLLTRGRDVHYRLCGPEQSDAEYDVQVTFGAGPVDRLMAFANSLAVLNRGAV